MRRTNSLIAGAIALLVATGAAAADATPPAAPAFSEADAKLLAIDTAIPLCTARAPKLGQELEDARRAWASAHPEEEASFQAKLSADAEATGIVKDKMQPVVVEAVNGLGDALCREFVDTLRRPGPLGQMDFDTAVGSYYQTVAGSRVLQEACSRLHPSLGGDIENDLKKWRADDADVQAVAVTRMEATMKEANSPLPALVAKVERAYLSMLDEAEKRGTGEHVCRTHFSDLASGTYRKETPNVYAAILRGPDPK